MSNIIHLDAPFRQNSPDARRSALLNCFAHARRPRGDVFWLKENAEILNILESTGANLRDDALSVYGPFYDDMETQMGFFPQYYRLLLSICLDLEDLGMDGATGETLTQWVAREGLPDGELSDLQRAEARRLCLRRGIDPAAHDAGLEDRLRGFARRSDIFAMPNRKAAYELTHIIFYLSEYGRADPRLDADTLDSLAFVGTLAFLGLDADLLAEICVALRFAGQKPPEIWEDWLLTQAGRFTLSANATAALADDYHPYLMVNWFMSVAGRGGFGQQVPAGRVVFRHPGEMAGPLRELSQCVYEMGAARSADWGAMRATVTDRLSEEAYRVLSAAEAAIDRFDNFFAGFARVRLQGASA